MCQSESLSSRVAYLMKKREQMISQSLKSKVTEPLAVASGFKSQLFKALFGNDFID
jgi:hypothetical protein